MKIPKIRRIYRPIDDWECIAAGMYANPSGGNDSHKLKFAEFFRTENLFQIAIDGVFLDWPKSCENFLTNESMNRIAWLGQAAVCYSTGLSSCYRGGFYMLTSSEQLAANNIAKQNLVQWILNARSKKEDRGLCKRMDKTMLLQWSTG